MLKAANGNMFNYDTEARVNTVNCVGVMGAGIALAFKNRYPAMFVEYQKACRAKQVLPGTLHVWHSPQGECVINFPTKRHWKESSRYEDITAGLLALRNYLLVNDVKSIALPALGCGHGGLDWAKVSQMISEHLGDLATEVYVFPPAVSHAMGRAAKQTPPTNTGNMSFDF